MNLYFGSTSEKFNYGHYLAVLSALRTQKVNSVCMMCTVRPQGYYWELVKDMVVISDFEFDDTQFPMVRGKDDNANGNLHFRAAAVKDYIEWVTLYNNGGIFIDLDTFSIRDMSKLLGNFDALATPEQRNNDSVYDVGVVIAKKGSLVAKEALGYAIEALTNPNSIYTSTGPVAFTKAVHNHPGLVGWPGYDCFGPRITKGILHFYDSFIPAWKEMPLPTNTYILHLYASSSKFNQIDREFIKSSKTMYANVVRSVLPISEWYI